MAEVGQPFRPEYLADSTEAIGGGKIDCELAAVLGCDVEQARRRKEQGMADGYRLPAVQDICSQYERTCGEIVKERKLIAADDQRFDLFMIGGGGRFPVLRRDLESRELPGYFSRERSLQLKPPKGLKDRIQFEADFDLLANACGLASSIDWRYYPPREALPMDPLPIRPKRDLEEYYPK